MAQKSRPNSASRKRKKGLVVPDGPLSQLPRPGRQAAPAGGLAGTQPPREAAGPSAAVAPLQRQAQRQRIRGKQTPPNRGKWVAAGIVLVFAVVLLAVIVARSVPFGPSVTSNETQQPPTAAGIHVAEGSTIQYQYTPPSSGPHYPSPANWGVYPQELAPGTWVHNLEHGGIVVLYRCPTACTDLQTQLQTLYSQLPQEQQFQERKVIITPYANLDHLLRVQAWGWTMPLDSVDSTAIDAFYQKHVDKGPEQIP